MEQQLQQHQPRRIRVRPHRTMDPPELASERMAEEHGSDCRSESKEVDESDAEKIDQADGSTTAVLAARKRKPNSHGPRPLIHKNDKNDKRLPKTLDGLLDLLSKELAAFTKAGYPGQKDARNFGPLLWKLFEAFMTCEFPPGVRNDKIAILETLQLLAGAYEDKLQGMRRRMTPRNPGTKHPDVTIFASSEIISLISDAPYFTEDHPEYCNLFKFRRAMFQAKMEGRSDSKAAKPLRDASNKLRNYAKYFLEWNKADGLIKDAHPDNFDVILYCMMPELLSHRRLMDLCKTMEEGVFEELVAARSTDRLAALKTRSGNMRSVITRDLTAFKKRVTKTIEHGDKIIQFTDEQVLLEW